MIARQKRDPIKIPRQVTAEMKEVMEEREAEMVQRLEEDRHATEELYHKKLALLKGNTEKRADEASVQAHTELLQQTRDIQRREADHSSQVRRLVAELETVRAELAASKAQTVAAQELAAEAAQAAVTSQPAAAAPELPAELLAEHTAALEAEREARERVEAELAELEASAAEGGVGAHSLFLSRMSRRSGPSVSARWT